MASLRRRLVGFSLLAVAATAFAFAAAVAPVIVRDRRPLPVPRSRRTLSDLTAGRTRAPRGRIGATCLRGVAAVVDADLSARTALLAPAFGAVGALILGTGISTDFGAPLAAFAASDALTTH